MEKHIWCHAEGRQIKVAWLALRREGSIVFMLNPQHAFQDRDHLHATLHPIAWHHVRESGKEPAFSGLADYSIMVEQEGAVPWLTARSNSIAGAKESDKPTNKAEVENWTLQSPTALTSVHFGVDILHPRLAQADLNSTTEIRKHVPWGEFVVRLTASLVGPGSAELKIYHFA